MKALWAFLLGCTVLTITTRSENPPRLFGGVLAGFVSFAQGARNIGLLVLPPSSSDFGSSTQVGLSFVGGLEVPLSTYFSLAPSLGFSTASATLKATEPTTFNVRGNAVPGIFEHDASLRMSWLSAYTSLIYHAGRAANFDLGVGIVIPTTGYLRATETIVEPTGITYVNGGTQRTTADAEFSNDASVMPMVNGRIYAILTKSSVLQLDFGFFGNMVFGSLIEGSDGWPTTVGLFLCGSFNFTSSRPRDEVRKSVVDKDTIVVVDPYNPSLREPRFIEVGRTTTADTVEGDVVRTITERTRITVEKHLPSPPPFLSVVIRTRLDTLSAPVPDVVVNVETTSDEPVQSVVVRGIINSDTIWTSRSGANRIDEVRWSFSELPEKYRNATAFTIRSEATVTDRLGQVQTSHPVHLSITRTK